MTQGTQEVPISSDPSPPPGDQGSHVEAANGNTVLGMPEITADSFITTRGPLEHLSGPQEDDRSAWEIGGQTLKPPVGPAESDPGHVFHLVADELGEDEPPRYVPFPDDIFRAPIPNRIFDGLQDLSGCAVRLAVSLMGAGYQYDQEAKRWRVSPRWWSIEGLQRRCKGTAMSGESIRRVASDLEAKGWVETRNVGGALVLRWALSAPTSGYTPVPAGLLTRHVDLSHSALVVLLQVYRETWGWTCQQDGKTKHRRAQALTTGDLAGACGFSKPTIRSAATELSTKAVDRERERAGAAYVWAPIPSFFALPEHKSFPPTSSESGCTNKRAGARERHTAGSSGENEHSEGRGAGQKERATSLSEAERRHVRYFTTETDLAFHVAARHVSRWSAEVVQKTRGAFEARRDDISKSEAGWLREAFRHGWFAPSIQDKEPDVQQDDGDFGAALQQFRAAERRAKQENGPSTNLSGGGKQRGRASRQDPGVGIGYDTLCDALDAFTFTVPAECWEKVAGRFVPTSEFGNWLWRTRDEMTQDGAEWAGRLIKVRKLYEQSRHYDGTD